MDGFILRDICDEIVGKRCVKLTFHAAYLESLVEFDVIATFCHRGACRLRLHWHLSSLYKWLRASWLCLLVKGKWLC